MPPTVASASRVSLQAFKAAFFKALAHPVRIRILEVLVRQQRSVQQLQAALALEQPIVSQHLRVLRTSQIVEGRKRGANVHYAVRDPLVGELLKVARRIFDRQLVGTQDLLRQLRQERGSEPLTPRERRPRESRAARR